MVQTKPSEKIGRFITKLNEAHIVTRYPEDMEVLKRDFTKEIVQDILTQSKETLEWIKKQLPKN